MIRRKNITFFSTIFLLMAVFIGNTAEFRVLAVNAQDDGIVVLGGIGPESEIVSEAAYVCEMETGIPVYSKNAHKKVYPASTTKIMTALVVLENERDLDKIMETPYEVFNEFDLGSSDRNKHYVSAAGILPKQDTVTVRDALYGMMLPSGCDAANVLAYNIGGGSMDTFFKMMNDKAAELGCKNTHFSNAHGLFEPENYSTAYDMFLITKEAMEKYPIFDEIVSSKEYIMPENEDEPAGYTVFSSNQLISESDSNPYFYEFAQGVKTGSLDEYFVRDADGEWEDEALPGFGNLVSIAHRDKFKYMVVTMKAPWHEPEEQGEKGLHFAYNDHRSLYNWAFSTFDYVSVLRKSDPITSVKITNGVMDEVVLYPMMEEDYWTLLPKDLDVESAVNRVWTLDADTVEAPVEKGTSLGKVKLMLNNVLLEERPLITNETVDKTASANIIDKIKGFFYYLPEKELNEEGESIQPEMRRRAWVIPTFVGLAVLTVALIVLNYMRVHRKKQYDKSKRKPPNRRIRR